MIEAKRSPVKARFDLLDPDFLREMAEVMGYGAEKYGPENWKLPQPGAKSGVNHAMCHIVEYVAGRPDDMTGNVETNLVKVAVNAMFEWYHYRRTHEITGLQEVTAWEKENHLDTESAPNATSDMVRNFSLFLASHGVIEPMEFHDFQEKFIASWDSDKCVNVYSHCVFIGPKNYTWHQTIAPGLEIKWGAENDETAAAIKAHIGQKET